MLKHYSHIWMVAKRRAVAALVPQNAEDEKDRQNPTSDVPSGDSKRVGEELGRAVKTG